MTNEKVIDRVRKLLALAGNNPSEAEAQAASERAHAMLAEYNLTLSDVENKAEKDADRFVTDSDMKTDSLPWRRQLGTMVAKMYFCNYLYAFVKHPTASRACGYIRYDRHYFIGARHNVEVAKHMFAYLDQTIDRLAGEESMRYPVRERTPFRTSFKHACAMRVCRRINDRIEESKRGPTVSGGTNLPALLDLYEKTQLALKSYLEQEFGEVKSSKSRGKPTHSGGWEAGKRAGDSIGLDQQVGRSQSKLLK